MSGRTKTQRERDRRKISQMYLQGEIQADIAAALGLSQPTVSRELKILQGAWREASLFDINEAKARELAKIDNLEIEYWFAWKNSLKDAETEIIETFDEEKKKQVLKKEGQSGNPAFLRGIEWCINKRCELLGLDAPKKADITSGGKPIERMTDNELLEFIASRVGAGGGGDRGSGAPGPEPADG